MAGVRSVLHGLEYYASLLLRVSIWPSDEGRDGQPTRSDARQGQFVQLFDAVGGY